MDNMQRNPFFLPSGFEPQEVINILEAKKDNKKRLDKIKERKRIEKKLLKQAKRFGKYKHAKIIYNVRLEFFLNNDCDTYPPATINESERVIKLYMRRIATMAHLLDMTFEECFAHCISHELIHQLLFDTEGNYVSWQFENICYIKHKNIKHWIGGVGCGEE